MSEKRNKKSRKIKVLRDLSYFESFLSLELCGETGKQKRFYTFCNKLYSNKLIRYKNAFLLIFVADMSLDKTSITSENQRILVIQLRLFNNSIYILPSNQPNNAIKKYFSNIHLLRNLLCSGCSGTDYQHFLYHHGYI